MSVTSDGSTIIPRTRGREECGAPVIRCDESGSGLHRVLDLD